MEQDLAQNLHPDKNQKPVAKKKPGCLKIFGIGCLSIILIFAAVYGGILAMSALGMLGDGNLGPVWSPDGSRIAFTSIRSGDRDIFMMNSDGSHVTQLTWDPWKLFYVFANARDSEPAWSPDGSQIAFISGRENPFMAHVGLRVFIINESDKKVTSLIAGKYSAIELTPAWSPDGKTIAFSGAGLESPTSITTMAIDGSARTDLNPIPHSTTWEPDWSPDGKKIVFSSNNYGAYDLFMINADGSGLERITSDPSNDSSPDWSPDGRQLAFVSDRDGVPAIYVMNLADKTVKRLTDLSSEYFAPDWSPDGSKIAYISGRAGLGDIYVMNSDGSNVIKLTGR